MRDVLVRPKEISLWQEAINLTLVPSPSEKSQPRKQAPYGKPEFDKLLADYDVVMDIPSCIFAEQLIQAYPDAQVLLPKRNYSAWETSMQESIWCLDTWTLFVFCRMLNLTQLAPLMRLVHSIFQVHSNNAYGGPSAKRSYESHYEKVRDLVPREKLLEIDVDQDQDWQPLCRFLGVQPPNEPFPKLNEEKAMRANLENAWWGMVRYLVLMVLLPGLVVVAGFLVYTYSDEIYAFRDEQILAPLKAYMDA